MILRMLEINRRHFLLLAELLVVGGTGVLLGFASSFASPMLVLTTLVGFGFVIVALKKHEFLLLGYLIFIIGIGNNPPISLGFGTLYFTDIVIFSGLGLIVLRSTVEYEFHIVRSPLNLPLLLFWGVALLSTFSAMINGTVTLEEMLGPIRALTSYLLFFLTINLIQTKQQLGQLWKGIAFLGIFTTLAMIAQYIVGQSFQILPGRVETLVTEGESFSNVTRVIFPGESLIFVLFCIFTVSIAFHKTISKNPTRLLIWGLLGFGVLLTFKRHFFMTYGIVLVFLFMFSNPRNRGKILTWIGLTILMVIILLLFISLYPNPQAQELVSASSSRLLSITKAETYSDPNSSFRWREFEYEYAFPQIEANPTIGIGWGSIYRPFVQGRDWLPGGNYRRFLHNGLLAILLRSGILGSITFFWLSAVFIFRGLKYWRYIPNDTFQAIVLGSTLAFLGMLVGSIVSPVVISANWTPLFGIMMGTNEVMWLKFNVDGLKS